MCLRTTAPFLPSTKALSVVRWARDLVNSPMRRQLGWAEFWRQRLSTAAQRKTVPGEKVLELLVVNRLIDPGSEFRVHRQWFDRSAMAELLEVDFAVAEKDRLYRCLDRILLHKQELFVHLANAGRICLRPTSTCCSTT